MKTVRKINRREFLSRTGRAGGAFALAASIPSGVLTGVMGGMQTAEAGESKADSPTSNELGVFVSIEETGDVQIICHRMEMGQGIITSTPQIIAEELCADWSKVTAVLGEANQAYGDQGTGGSASIRHHIKHTRKMGAVARDMLEAAAAQVWGVEKSEVKAQDHTVVHRQSKKVLGFGELAKAAAKLMVPDADAVSLKLESEFTLIGKDVALQGIESIVRAEAIYAHDVQLPDMLIASIERPPVVGGRVVSFDDSAAKKVNGVVDVIRMKDRSYPVQAWPKGGVAVLATNTWAAQEGRKKLKVEWDHGDNVKHDSEVYKKELIAKVNSKAKAIRTVGDVYSHDFDASKTLEATYTMPYHHHMSMETPAATAHVQRDKTQVWSGTQAPQWGQSMILQELGLDPKKDQDKVEFNTTLMGGAFGRKSKNDFTLEAVELSKLTGKPVKVVWTREDDVKNGFYHSVAANYMKAELNQDNRSDYWVQRLASPPIAWIFNDQATYLDNGALSLGFADVPFDVENMSFENQEVSTHVRTGWVRAVGNLNNQFALGSFVDELAIKAGISTQQMWLNLFGEDRFFNPSEEGFKDYSHYGQTVDKDNQDYVLDIARFKAVLNRVVKEAKANEKLPDGQGWGISVSYSFNSYAAAATKVEVKDDTVTPLEMHTAIDCGLVITPDRVRSQMEGAMIMGLSMVLQSEITVKDGAIVQNNFYDYPVSRINQVPPMFVHLVESDQAPGGVGEPGLPPILPSITNAIAHASGVRVRDLPVSKVLKVS